MLIFDPQISFLSDLERQMVVRLDEACSLIDALFLKQYNPKTGENYLYPADVSDEEILSAAKSDQNILDPYHVVEKNSGKLRAIPYHEYYSSDLDLIATKLNEAAYLASQRIFRNFLRYEVRALQKGYYEGLIIFWLTLPQGRIDFLAGPLKPHFDHRFSTKRFYQASTGVMDEVLTSKATQFRDTLFRAKQLFVDDKMQKLQPDVVQIRVDHTTSMGGLAAELNFYSQVFPRDFMLMNRFGSRGVMHLTNAEKQFSEHISPIIERLFSAEINAHFTRGDLFNGYVYNGLIDVLTQQGIVSTTGINRESVDEIPLWKMIKMLTSMQSVMSLNAKGLISEKETKSVVVTMIAWMIMRYTLEKEKPHLRHYGAYVPYLIDYLIHNKGITLHDHKIEVDYKLSFGIIDTLFRKIKKQLQGSNDDQLRAEYTNKKLSDPNAVESILGSL